MRVLVTGGAGFIGSHLIERLLGLGHVVTCLDNFDDYYDPGIKRQNLDPAARSAGFRLVAGDVQDATLAERLLADGCDVVIHLAARAGVRPSIADPWLYERINVGGTVNLLESCRRHPVGHFVFASSSSVYGLSTRVPFREETSDLQPASPYGASKLAAEQFCQTFQHLYRLPVTCLRFFTVYGPRQRPDMAIHRFTRLIEGGQPVPVYGDGSSRRDYTYIEDVVDGIVRAALRPQGYQVYNLGNQEPVMLRDLVAMLGHALVKPVRVSHQPDQPGDVPTTYASIERATRHLGYQPRVKMRDGLREFVRWFRAWASPRRDDLEAPSPVQPVGSENPTPSSAQLRARAGIGQRRTEGQTRPAKRA